MTGINRTLAAVFFLVCASTLATAQSVKPATTKSPTAPATSATATKTNDISDIGPLEHPATVAQIRELLTLTNTIEKAHDEMKKYIKNARATASPDIPAAFWDDMEKAALEIDIVTPSIAAYQKYYSQEDMAAAIAFYRSPAGRRMIAAQPFLSSILAESLRKAGEQVGLKVGLKYKDEIKKIDSQTPLDVVVTSN
jgi:hypothetical protein